MSVDELVVRLQATLDEIEQLAEPELDGRCQDGSWHTKHCGYRQQEWQEPCECDVPDTILRLVQSHRDVIDEWQKQAQIRDQLADEAKGSDEHLTTVGITAGLWAAVTLLARGYGLEET